MPARKELPQSATRTRSNKIRGALGYSRNAHNCAQGEQHEETVPHVDSCTLRYVAGAGEWWCAGRTGTKETGPGSAYNSHASTLCGGAGAGAGGIVGRRGVVAEHRTGMALLASANMMQGSTRFRAEALTTRAVA